MDFDFSPEEQAFADEVEAWLVENHDPVVMDPTRENFTQLVDTPERRAFMKKLAAQGWLGMSWPKEYGGQEIEGVYEFILNEALAKHAAPQIGKGVGIIGKTLIRHGSEKLKQEFLPKILNAEVEFAVGYSEPQAGSDAANMQLKAEKVEGGWKLNGQKIWTTSAHFADWYWVGARTDPEKKHDGISLFLIPMDDPGLEVQSMPTIGKDTTNQVFFTDVFVPDEYMVGEEGKGFRYISEALDLERFTMFTLSPIEARTQLLCEHVRDAERDGEPLRDDPRCAGRWPSSSPRPPWLAASRCASSARRRGAASRPPSSRRSTSSTPPSSRSAPATSRSTSWVRAASYEGRHRGGAPRRPLRGGVPLHRGRDDRRRGLGDPEEHHRPPQARAAEELLSRRLTHRPHSLAPRCSTSRRSGPGRAARASWPTTARPW